jgi:hypothetical protein
MRNSRRSLNQEERLVLDQVQALWGPQNTDAEVFFTEANEAALFVKARDGSLPVCVSLTNLGRWHADGTLTLPELRNQILGPDVSEPRPDHPWARFKDALLRLLRP